MGSVKYILCQTLKNIGQFKCDIFDKLTSNYPKAKVQIIKLCARNPVGKII